MRTRTLGTSDLDLTTIGYGAWAIGGGDWAFGWGPQDDDESVKAIHAAMDCGINWIDTAAIYGLGHSEEVVARALKDRKGKMLVATKCGLRWRSKKKIYSSLKAQSVREEVEASLRRLEVDAIDLYQIHWPDPDGEIEEGWGAIADMVKEGKLRHAGVSNFDVEQLKRAREIAPVVSLQPPYSMINRKVEAEILPFCAAEKIGVVAYSPLQCGLLTGAFDRQRLEGMAKGDWRRGNQCFKDPIFGKALELVERLRPVAERTGHTTAQLAAAWVLETGGVTAAIVGARRPSQIEETAAAGDWEIGTEDLSEISRILAEVAVPTLAAHR